MVGSHRGKNGVVGNVPSGGTITFSRNSPTAIITTKCKGKALDEDEVELKKIRVETVRTIEIEENREGKSTASSDSGDEWVGSQKGVVGERIV
jgi:hypothetical protein